MPDRVILRTKWDAVAAPGSLRKAVNGFLRYVQYRDKHADSPAREPASDPKVSGLLKYVAYRDDSARQGLLFGPVGPAGDAERRELAAFIASAAARTRPQPHRLPDGSTGDRRRAVHRMVISPEDARGLDLRELTRAMMQQLAADAAPGGLQWIAAEHRNTAHRHVHVVLAGFADLGDGRVRGLVITPRRLARMKEALAAEVSRQRGIATELATAPPTRRGRRRPRPSEASRRRLGQWVGPLPSRRRRPIGRPSGLAPAALLLRRAAARYRAEAERDDRRRDRDRWFER